MLVYICIDLITDLSPSFQDCYKRSRTQSLKLSSWARLTRCTNFPFGCAGRDVQQFCSTDANKVRGKGSAGTAEVGNAPLDVMRFVAVFVRMKAGMGLEDPWIPTCRKGIPKIRCLHLRGALCPTETAKHPALMLTATAHPWTGHGQLHPCLSNRSPRRCVRQPFQAPSANKEINEWHLETVWSKVGTTPAPPAPAFQLSTNCSPCFLMLWFKWRPLWLMSQVMPSCP